MRWGQQIKPVGGLRRRIGVSRKARVALLDAEVIELGQGFRCGKSRRREERAVLTRVILTPSNSREEKVHTASISCLAGYLISAGASMDLRKTR